MPISDILAVLHWWVLFFLFSVAFLPLTAILFKPFFDKGYIFSKPVCLIVLSYLALLVGIFQITSFTFTSLTVLLSFITAINYITMYSLHRKSENGNHIIAGIKRFVSSHWKIILLEEVLFLAGIFFLAYIRSFSPEIHGLEKYMDYGFMNSIGRSDYFPPKDMWLTPFFINYYYFGHFTGAVLTKLSSLPANITYNLILASVFSMSFVASFSLGANLFHFMHLKTKLFSVKRFLAGLLTAFLVTLSGNLHTLYAFFKPYENEIPVPIWQLPFLPTSFPNSYWYPNATRYIYHTIHEFPMYSWVVADLHGHVFDIPFVLTILAILLSLLARSETRTEIRKQAPSKKLFFHSGITFLKDFWYLPLLGFILSIMYMTNAWDGLIYLLLSGLFILYMHATSFAKKHKLGIALLFNIEFISSLAIAAVVIFLGFLLFSLPFSLFFKPFVSGIGVLCAPEVLTQKGVVGPFLFEADHCQRSPWWQLVILYGFFYFFIFSFLAFLTRVKNVRISDTFVLLLIILGTVLIIIPEFIYVKDIYPAHYRANTMFKLVFQAFILLSVASSYAIVRIVSSSKARKLHILEKIPTALFVIVTLFFLVTVFIYPFQSITSYYGELKKYSGLDGTKYLDELYPSDYQGILWLNNQVKGQPVILEAQGDSYTDFARVSANTGLPTILGWTVHEWLWRNNYDIPNPPANPSTVYEVPAPRIAEIQSLYESNDLNDTKRLLKKYHVEYIFLGTLERQKYPNLNEEKWSTLGKIVFKQGVTTIYHVSDE